ncbi:hypothetical protein [Nocardioides ungokensis]|uniref:hypothetical protein n=1 Tax=Nocardioides ungokensis TaxID=1643322 RepID=UPI0015DE0062|nr:hypothetical protein [Nocardioides ungokensis]
MPRMTPAQASARGKRAIAIRHGNKAAAEQAAAELRFANYEARLRALTDNAPALTDEQRQRILSIILSKPAGPGGGS